MTVEMPKTPKQKLKERIEKNLVKLEKQQKIKAKMEKKIDDYKAKNSPLEPLSNLEKYPYCSDARDARIDFDFLMDDYERKCYIIKKLEDLIERQKEQYKTAKDELTEKARRDYLAKILPPLPEVLLKLKDALEPNILKALTKRNEEKRPQRRHTEEELQREAKYQARCLVETVWLRIFEKTGKLTSCDHVYIRGCELNGYFTGENARVSVHTIYAGGYNIQCLHMRTLVHVIEQYQAG